MKLPLNCSVDYYKDFLTKEECTALYKDLTSNFLIASLNKQNAAGKVFYTDFGKIMFLDQDLYETDKFPELIWGKSAVWSDQLKGIKLRVEELTKEEFHVCVCIYYPNGNSGVGYHADYMAYGDTSVIPSLSIGEERDFLLREKSSLKEYRIKLDEGSLLIMGAFCQERYDHSLPVNSAYLNGRINLTFRKYGLKR